jgi:hypothetical protein
MRVKCEVKIQTYNSMTEEVWYHRDIDWCCSDGKNAWSDGVIDWASWADNGSMAVMRHSSNPREDSQHDYRISHCPWCGEEIETEEISRVKVVDGEEFPVDTRDL